MGGCLSKPTSKKSVHTQTSEIQVEVEQSMHSFRSSRSFRVVGPKELDLYRVSRTTPMTNKSGNSFLYGNSPLHSPQFTRTLPYPIQQSSFSSQRKSMSYNMLADQAIDESSISIMYKGASYDSNQPYSLLQNGLPWH